VLAGLLGGALFRLQPITRRIHVLEVVSLAVGAGLLIAWLYGAIVMGGCLHGTGPQPEACLDDGPSVALWEHALLGVAVGVVACWLGWLRHHLE
jgi:hypothetical protein